LVRVEPGAGRRLSSGDRLGRTLGRFDETALLGRLDSLHERGTGAPPAPNLSTKVYSNPSPLSRTKLGVARAAVRVNRASGRGGGTSAPGRMLLKMAPGAIGQLASRLERGSVLVSGTNGKTTTASLLASILRAAGWKTVHNKAGANARWGIATALLEPGQIGVFEVDEAWLTEMAAEIRPQAIVFCNLSRDRLDTYGEMESLVERWKELVDRAAAPSFVICADDPLIATLGERNGSEVTLFGIEDRSQGYPRPRSIRDAVQCDRCGAAYRYERAFVGHMGHYSCECYQRPAPGVAATAIALRGMSGSDLDVSTPAGTLKLRLALPGLFNAYNTLAAVAAAIQLGVPERAIQGGLESMSPVFGRGETIRVGSTRVSLLLMKNPVGATELLRTLALEPERRLDIWIPLNDTHPDGRDTSWIWDVDFEPFAGRVGQAVCGGSRAPEMALRLKYAGVSAKAIESVDGIAASFDRAIELAGERLFALPTYSAMIQIRTLLAERGLAAPYWK
jgi:lipid II isoglutaminyl synthase (glutamine-hydrolysing)